MGRTCDSQNLGHVRHNMNYALTKLRPPAVGSGELLRLDQLFAVTHTDRFTSHSIAKPWHSFNPSIVPHPHDPEREFLVNLRVGNYSMNAQHKYMFPAGHTGIHTKNMLTAIPVDFSGSDVGKATLLKAEAPPHPYAAIQGEEDLRIVPGSGKADGTMLVTFTSLEYTAQPLAQVCMATLDWKKGRILNAVRLHGIDAADRAQKNWQCFLYNGVPHAVYSYQPLVVVRIERETGECRIVSLDACTIINEWRGSSPLMPLPDKVRLALPDMARRHQDGDRWFCSLVHISKWPAYSHEFAIVRLRPSPWSNFRPFSLQVAYVTPPFVFKTHDVEFSCGFAFTPDAAELVLPYALRDEFCSMSRLTTDSFVAKCVPIPLPDDFVI